MLRGEEIGLDLLTISTVQHSGQEDEPVAGVASLVVPSIPHSSVGCISRSSRTRHDGANQDTDQASGKDEKKANVVDHW